MATVHEDSATPQFAHSVRGYDRIQVDEYVQRLTEWAGAAQARAAEAERQAAARLEELGRLHEQIRRVEAERPTAPEQAVQEAADRAAEAVKAALREADQLRRRAAAESERRLDEAGERAVGIVEAAQTAMVGLTEEATRERREAAGRVDAMIDKASRQADELRDRAEADADRILTEARATAASLVAEAEAAANQIRERSDQESRLAAEAVQRLQAERTQIVDELGRLRGAIQALIADPPPEVAEAALQAPREDAPVEHPTEPPTERIAPVSPGS